MAWQFDVNSANNSTGVVVMFRLLTLLLANGWTVLSSGTGSAGAGSGVYDAAGNAITSSALLGNTKAWFVMKCPNGRQFCVQNVSAGSNFRVKYSVAAGFVGGAPSASQVPSATDEQVIAGSGTDAAPTGATGGAADGSYKAHVIVGQATEGYSFGVFGIINGGTNDNGFVWVFDALITGLSAGADQDPYAHAWAWQPSFSNLSGIKYWVKFGLAGVAWVANQAANMLNNIPAFQNPYTAADDLFPVFYASTAVGSQGYKGVSTIFRHSSVARNLADTWSRSSARDWLCLGPTTGQLAIPWAGVVPVL